MPVLTIAEFCSLARAARRSFPPDAPRFRAPVSLAIPVALCIALCSALPETAQAEPTAAANRSGFFRCDVGFSGERTGSTNANTNGPSWARSDAAIDLYNGLAYFGAVGAVTFGGQTQRRWSNQNAFDRGIRDGVRLKDRDARRDAGIASDVGLLTSGALLPLATIGFRHSQKHDCAESLDMLTDYVESMGLTILVTESIKLAAGRARPFENDCNGAQSLGGVSCGDVDRFRSFISGHASVSAAGAGLTCAFSLKRNAWGDSRAARWVPCGLGAAAALATGSLRIAADEHWVTDVVAGFVLGATIGYFDTWGPFDFLKFENRDARGAVSSQGLVMPRVQGDHFGAQLVMVF